MDQMNIFDLCYPMVKIDKPIRLIELFAGYGSQAMALERMGVQFEHYRCVEVDRYAIASYNAIHGTDFEPMDIKKLSASELGIVDTDKYCYIVTYSFPCTDISLAGGMEGMEKNSGTRSGLLWEVERLLNELDELPMVLVMENVTQVHSERNIKSFEAWMKFLQDKGYSNFYQDLNAKDYGVAQNRDRTIMVSVLGQVNYKFPIPIDLRLVADDYLEEEVDEKYYLTSEKATDLIEKLLDNGKVEDYTADERTNERTNEQTDS